jgi:hypothetical protein
MYMPHENITFLANSSICTNSTASRRLVWESHGDVNSSQGQWYDLWIASGFIATLLIKVAMANFGLALMELADPFVVCAGEFLWMPTSFGSGRQLSTRASGANRQILEAFDEQGRSLPSEMVRTWFQAKQRALFHCALSKVLFWGFLVHLCLVNLFESVYKEVYEGYVVARGAPPFYALLEERDLKVLAGCLVATGAVLILGVFVIRYLNRLSARNAENIGDTDDSSSDSDVGEP